jgi:zinc resistance-associated protein
MRNTSFAAFFLLLCAVTPASAQQQPAAGGAAQPASASPASTVTPEDLADLADARIAALREGLKLRPDQQKNWAPVETTLRDIAKQRQDRLRQLSDAQKAANGQPPDPIAALRRQADTLTQASADLKRFADAAEPLYKSLDDAQKLRMIVLVRNVVLR